MASNYRYDGKISVVGWFSPKTWTVAGGATLHRWWWTGANRTNPRPWLPITEDSIEHEAPDGTIMKFLVNQRQTNLFTQDGLTQPMATDPWVDGGVNVSSCIVCSLEKPCLYDLTKDPAVRSASKHPV